MAVEEEIHALELALARRRVADLPGGYAAVLDEAFVEIGSSGRRWSRAEMLEALASAPPTDAISIEGFATFDIGPDVVLVLYDTVGRRSDGVTVRSRRSSLWVHRDGRFRLRFHQGTPVPDDPI